MLTDAAALGLALVAASFAGRPAVGRWTFGFRRLEILAAHINGTPLLLVVGVVIVFTAVRRARVPPPEVPGGIVLVVAARRRPRESPPRAGLLHAHEPGRA